MQTAGKAEIVKCYIIAEGLIERHARECEENAEQLVLKSELKR